MSGNVVRVSVNKGAAFSNYINFCKAFAIVIIAFWHYFFDLFRFDLIFLQKDAISTHFHIFPLNGLSGILVSISTLALALGAGVFQLFLIASGFGLYLSHLKDKKSWTLFYKKRALRVLFLYWIAVIFNYFIRGAHVPPYFQARFNRIFVEHLLVLQDYTKHPAVWGALWFIGYIIQLYVLFPVFVKMFQNRAAKALLILISVFGTFLAAKAASIMGFELTGRLPVQYLSSFVFGMLLAEGAHFQKDFFKKLFRPASISACAILALLMVYLVNQFTFFNNLIFNNLFYIFFFVALYPVFKLASAARALRRVLNALAYSSYVIFLSHQLISLKAFLYFARHWPDFMFERDFFGVPIGYKTGNIIFLRS